jgi:hypothetical protein
VSKPTDGRKIAVDAASAESCVELAQVCPAVCARAVSVREGLLILLLLLLLCRLLLSPLSQPPLASRGPLKCFFLTPDVVGHWYGYRDHGMRADGFAASRAG